MDLRKVVALSDVQERFHTLGTYTRDLTPRADWRVHAQ